MSNDLDSTPRGRVRSLVREQLVAGDDVPGITERLLPLIPIGDVQTLMRSGVERIVRDELRQQGFVLDHRAVDAGDPAPIAVWVQFELDDVLTHIRHAEKQQRDDDAALERRLADWCAAHHDMHLTPKDLRELAAT